MTAHLEAAALIGLCAAGLVAVVIITRYAIRLERRITRLQAEVEHLRDAQGKRIPYDLRKTIENAVFAVGRFEIELDENRAMLDNAKAHLMKLTKE